MKTDLLRIVNAQFTAAVESNKVVVGYLMLLLDIDGKQHTEYVGMFDIYRAPLSDILTSKGGYKLTIEDNEPVIVDKNGNHYNHKFFEDMSKRTNKRYTVSINELPQEVNTYLSTQHGLFRQHILNKGTEVATPVVQPQPVPPTQAPVQQAPVVPTQAPVAPVQPTQAPVQQAPVVPTPVQPTVIPSMTSTISVEPKSVAQNPNKELVSTDDFPVGTMLVKSVINPNQRLPQYMGLNEKGEKLYGPDKYTEEECLAVIQLQQLVNTAGEHLLTEKEKEMLDRMNEGVTANFNSNTVDGGMDMQSDLGGITALGGARSAILQKITATRRAEHNVLELKNKVETALRDGTPFEIAGSYFSFHYMALVGPDGEPPAEKRNLLLVQRGLQLKEHGKLVSKDVKPKQSVDQTPTSFLPTGGATFGSTPQPISAPQTARPVLTSGSPTTISSANSPFTRTVQSQVTAKQSTKSATAIIRKFISTDGHTIEGIIFDVNGTLQGQAVNRRCLNSLERISQAFSGLMRQLEFTNAELVKNAEGKLEVIMTEEQLNLIDIIPANRFVTARQAVHELHLTTLVAKDTRLTEMVNMPEPSGVDIKAVDTPQQPVTTQVATPQQPVTTQVATPVQEAPTNIVAPTPHTSKEMPPTVKQFVEFLTKVTQPVIPITGLHGTTAECVVVNVEEMKQYFGV